MTDDQEPVGSVSDEAAKLLGAVQDWAKSSGSEYAKAAADAASGAASTIEDLNEHIATDGADCKYCPICQVISAVRATSPEVKQHLASAATSLMHAVAGAMATDVSGSGRRGRDTKLERIALSDDDWED